MARNRVRLRPGQRSALDAMGITRWVGRQSTGDEAAGDTAAVAPARARPDPLPGKPEAMASPAAPDAAVASRRDGHGNGAGNTLGSGADKDAGVASALAAREAAGDGAAGLARLQVEVSACTRCRLHETRTQTVFGVGNPRATWMVVGEAPGAEEDRQGEPFVGRAGQLLNEMVRAIGLSREEVYIANVLKCRPPENRDPKPDESASCEDYLQQQIMLVRPRILLAVGRIAAQNLLKTETPIGRLRGHVHHYGPLDTPLVVTYHPAYLLRSPGQKRRAWEDLVLARRTVQTG